MFVVFYFNFCDSGKEILYRVGNNLGTRQTFQSLCPNKPVREEVYGNKVRCQGVCRSLPIEFQDLQFTQNCYLFELGGVDLVLGME